MGLTDLGEVPLPQALLHHFQTHDRMFVTGQVIDIAPTWWNEGLDARHLPGGPVEPDVSGPGSPLSRGTVQSLATEARTNPDAALRLLWYSLAWGVGHRLRQCTNRLDSIVAMGPDRAGFLLERAAARSVTDALSAYEMLAPDGRSAIPYLGPAFSTKFLYFAGAGVADHPCMILDSRVAYALHHNGWTSLPADSYGWPPSTYERYLHIVRHWGGLAESELGRAVAHDEIEYWLFQVGAPATPDE